MSLRDYGRTAAVVTIGDEVVEGRVSNENAVWICDALMRKGIWPRLVLAVPDDEETIARMLRVAWDAADIVVVSGGLGFTPDDVTRRAVARACLRDLVLHEAVAVQLSSTLTWATPDVARSLATFPEGSQPRLSTCGGVPGFSVGDIHVLPGSPTEVRAMLASIDFPESSGGIFTATLTCETTEDQIRDVLISFEGVHEGVRLGSYPSFSGSRPQVGLVLSSRDESELHEATEWVAERLPCTISGNA
jgi:molybdenum cofactor synthesis domain-containing protein